jgi:hypothetical protein
VPFKILAGEGAATGQDLVGRALGDDLAAMDAGAGAHVDDIVGGADRVLVMLDHEHGVAEVAQALERFEQPVVVALVQADRRFVEHIEHAGQAGADLAGEADALALAAGKRAGGAIEVEVIEADIVEEAQTLVDFLEDAPWRSRSADRSAWAGSAVEPGSASRIERWARDRRWIGPRS